LSFSAASPEHEFPLARASALVFSAYAALCFAVPLAPAQSPTKPLTIEEIFAHGPLIGSPPQQLTWSPDGKHLTYLDGGELIDLDPVTGRPHVLVSRAKMTPLDSLDGSERDRDHRQRYNLGSYFWSPDSTHLLFDSNGAMWYYDLHNGIGLELGQSGMAAGDDPKFSPNGEYVSFIRDHGLAVIPLRTFGTPTIEIAPAPAPGDNKGDVLLNGEVDWVYEEELDVRSNYFWSPDSRHIAYLQMNETNVPRYPLVDWIPTHATVAYQVYPQPGDANPDVRIGVVSAHGGRTDWVRLPMQPGQDYIPRFGWADEKTLWIEVLTRDQRRRQIFFVDPFSGEGRLALEISDDKFLDDNYDIYVGDGHVVLTDWTGGHNQIYLYSYDKAHPTKASAKLVRQLTTGSFEVTEVYKVDEKNKLIDYASNQGNPLDQQVWQVSFEGVSKQLSAGVGFHEANFSPVGEAYAEKQSARIEAPVMSICRSVGKCNVFWQTRALASYHLRAPEQLEVKAQDGETLYASLLMPPDIGNAVSGPPQLASVPLIVNPYGGPGEQGISDRWNDSLLFDELLAEHGFAVLHADNRGMGGRGRAFAQAAYHDFGPVQLQDQLAVLDDVLAKHPELDPKRLGWWGWSWGGTFTLYAMTHSDRFRAGVAVAPVTDWRDYDSIYTERYLNEPAAFPSGYHDFSVVDSAANLKGRLLLAIGTGDDNVHIENTVQFIQALIEAGIPYDLQIFPGKTHSISGSDVRTALYKRILSQFEDDLTPATASASPAR
jgi:dipeptidyl-peptidase 4